MITKMTHSVEDVGGWADEIILDSQMFVYDYEDLSEAVDTALAGLVTACKQLMRATYTHMW